jgi:hypothetical protein
MSQSEAGTASFARSEGRLLRALHDSHSGAPNAHRRILRYCTIKVRFCV